MSNKYGHIKLNYKIWLENEQNEGILGDGKWVLLKTIHDTGSLKAALEKLGWSYRKTWNNLKQIEKRLGFPILETSRGGAEKGNTFLTEDGKRIVKLFDQFHAKTDDLMQQEFEKFQKELQSLK